MPIEVRTLAEWEATGVPGMLSVVIPAHNEEGHIADTVRGLADTLRRAGIDYEIVVVNDNSNDAAVLAEILWLLLLWGPGKFWSWLDEESESYRMSADGNGRDHFLARGVDHRHVIRSGICDINFAAIWVHR